MSIGDKNSPSSSLNVDLANPDSPQKPSNFMSAITDDALSSQTTESHRLNYTPRLGIILKLVLRYIYQTPMPYYILHSYEGS